jgi:hypothetical protein
MNNPIVQPARPTLDTDRRSPENCTEPEPLLCCACHYYHATVTDRLKAHPDAPRRDGGAMFLRAIS